MDKELETKGCVHKIVMKILCKLQLAICISHLSNLASMTRYSNMTSLVHHARNIKNTVQRGKNFLMQGKQKIQIRLTSKKYILHSIANPVKSMLLLFQVQVHRSS